MIPDNDVDAPPAPPLVGHFCEKFFAASRRFRRALRLELSAAPKPMSEPPTSPYQSAQTEAAEAKARARDAIESAIATLQAHRSSISEGQGKAIKRILYGHPEQ